MKNRLKTNLIIDAVMLVLMVWLSLSGFILETILPARHGMCHAGMSGHVLSFGGLGRHDWGEIHGWVGLLLAFVLVVHVLLHRQMLAAFLRKQFPDPIGRGIVYGIIGLLLLCVVLPWVYVLGRNGLG